MNEPHKCPVCDGTGLVSRPPYIAGDQPTWSSTSLDPYPCKCCNGTGIVWSRIAALEKELAELRRGEFICRKCFLRKDGEPIECNF